MKIAVFSTKPYDQNYFEKYDDKHEHKLTYFETTLDESTVNLTKGFEAICIFVNDKCHKTIINALAKNGVKLIALRCAGYNNVNLEAAEKQDIKVVRVPAYSPEAVAEHAVALIQTLNRKTHKAYNRIREGNFSLNNLMGFNLYAKTVGVIGTGIIGSTFCKIMLGFGCKVVAFDIKETKELKDIGVKFMDLNDLFKTSDIISLHCPLNPKTKHIIDAQSITKMKDGVMIINTSRGALIDTANVIDFLSNKKIGFLGIDVYEQEENFFFKDLSESIIQDDLLLRLNSFPNVLITSHQAFFTKEAMHEITSTTIKNFNAFEQGKHLENAVS